MFKLRYVDFYLNFFNKYIYSRINNNLYEDILSTSQFSCNNVDAEDLQVQKFNPMIFCGLVLSNPKDYRKGLQIRPQFRKLLVPVLLQIVHPLMYNY